MARLADSGARLVPRSRHHTIEPAFWDGIAVWARLAGRDTDALDLYRVPDGLICVDEADAAELHLQLETTPTNGQPLAIACFIEEMSW